MVLQHWERNETNKDEANPANARIRDLSQSIGISPIQLEPYFKEALKTGNNPYRDNTHPNQIGQQLIAKAILKNLPNNVIHKAGDSAALHPGPSWQALSRRAKLGVSCKVRVHCWARRDPRLRLAGYVPVADILRSLRTADIALIPSRWQETGPITVFEARAAGLPIIGADRGGVGELLVDDGGSQLFPPEDAKALAGILNELAKNGELVAEMHKQVRVPRTSDEVASEVVSVYERLLRRHRRMTTPKHR